MFSEVAQVVDVLRPAVRSDGGDIELVGVDESTGVVELLLSGTCGTCPSSSGTMRAGVERILKDRVPSVTAVVETGGAPVEDGTPVAL